MPPRLLNHSVCRECSRLWRRTSHRRFASSSPEIYDVIAVGGGPVGLALLAALKSSPKTSHLKTALIETQDLTKQRHQKLSSPDTYSNRASSLTPSSLSFLESLDAWQHIDQTRIQQYNEMQVWDGGNDSSIQFDWSDEARRYNAPRRTVATMVENSNLTAALLERIHELQAEESLIANTRVCSIDMGSDQSGGLDLSNWPVLSLESSVDGTSQGPSQIAARLLVGADGFNSPVRTFAGIPSHGWDYNRHGVVATLRVEPSKELSYSSSSDEAPNNATAFQRFLPSLGGPIAILPLPNNHASLVWSTTPANAAYLKSLPLSTLPHILNAALRLSQTDVKYLFTLPPSPSASSTSTHESELSWRIKHTPAPAASTLPPTITSIQPNSLASFPLRFRHASSLTAPRIALAGDAAHTIHPLAGQGLNLGLADAKALADTIAYAATHGMDVGDATALEVYGRSRFGRGMVVAGGVDFLNWVYQLGGGGDEGMLGRILGRARGVGMAAVGGGVAGALGVKAAIMRVAEGG